MCQRRRHHEACHRNAQPVDAKKEKWYKIPSMITPDVVVTTIHDADAYVASDTHKYL